MSRNPRRTQLAPGYILHHLPYRDTSRILEVLTREHGRLTLFARGVRGPKAKLARILEPFELLLFSWSGGGEAAQLTGAEPAGALARPPSAALMACFYLSELVLKLTTRHDPHPRLFDAYHEALGQLKAGAALEPALRLFEKRLLEEVGYGLDLASEGASGRPLERGAHYRFRPAQGLMRVPAGTSGALEGTSLLSLAAERLTTAAELEDARRLLGAALDHCLEGRELATRVVARSIARRRSVARRAASSSESRR
ncbi:MAG TPA: DNA repair protein RecO [Steroidobacteraceae bacterium]|nr:DNA repair protein RecO [Steroidobacteraceae bacterium]